LRKQEQAKNGDTTMNMRQFDSNGIKRTFASLAALAIAAFSVGACTVTTANGTDGGTPSSGDQNNTGDDGGTGGDDSSSTTSPDATAPLDAGTSGTDGGTGGDSSSPAPIGDAGPGTPVSVSAGSAYACALTGSGEVECWNNDGSGNPAKPFMGGQLTSGVTAVAAGGNQSG
jgi:hypothetical protein